MATTGILGTLFRAAKSLFEDQGPDPRSIDDNNTPKRDNSNHLDFTSNDTKSENFITKTNQSSFSSIRVPVLERADFTPRKISGDDVLRSIDAIHEDIVKYQNIINKNVVSTFTYIKAVAKYQDQQITALSSDFGTIKTKVKRIEEDQLKFKRQLQNYLRKHENDDLQKPRVRVKAPSRPVKKEEILPTPTKPTTPVAPTVVGSSILGSILAGGATAAAIGGALAINKYGNEKNREAFVNYWNLGAQAIGANRLKIEGKPDDVKPDPDIEKVIESDPKAKEEWDKLSATQKQQYDDKAKIIREGRAITKSIESNPGLAASGDMIAPYQPPMKDEKEKPKEDEKPSFFQNFLYNATGGLLGKSMKDEKKTDEKKEEVVPLPKPRPKLEQHAEWTEEDDRIELEKRKKIRKQYASLSPDIYKQSVDDEEIQTPPEQRQNVLPNVPNALSQQTSINVEEAKETQLAYKDYTLKRQNIKMESLQSISLTATDTLTLKGQKIKLQADEIEIDTPFFHSKGSVDFLGGSSSAPGGSQQQQKQDIPFPADDTFGGDTSKNIHLSSRGSKSKAKSVVEEEEKPTTFGPSTEKFTQKEGLKTGTFHPVPITPTTEGGSKYLAKERSWIKDELEKDPSLHRLLRGVLAHEQDPGERSKVFESLANRLNYLRANGQPNLTLKDYLSRTGKNQFYNPLRKGEVNEEYLNKIAPQNKSIDKEIDKVLGGSNDLRGMTDQGSKGDPNFGVGETIKSNGEGYNDFGGRGHQDKAQRYRLEQQKRVAEEGARESKISTLKVKKGEPEVAQVKPDLFSPNLTKIPNLTAGNLGPAPAEEQASRPSHLRGKLDFMGEKFDFGSGGGGFESIPFGNYPVTPNTVGPWGQAHGALGINNNVIKDTKLGRNRNGIELHSGSSDQLLTEGCIAIAGPQWAEFKAKVLQRIKNGEKLFLHVGKDGTSITNHEGDVVGKSPKVQESSVVKREKAPIDSPLFSSQPLAGTKDVEKFIQKQEKEDKRVKALQEDKKKEDKEAAPKPAPEPEAKKKEEPKPVKTDLPEERFSINEPDRYQDARYMRTSHHPESVTPDQASPEGFTKLHWDQDGVFV